MQHKYVTTEWSTPGYFGRVDCVCCGFAMLGNNRVLTVRHPRGVSATICDGCVDAIAKESDGRLVTMSGNEAGRA